MAEQSNVSWHPHQVSRADRERLNGHKGCVIWFTGFSGSGKSTVANLVDRKLHSRGVHTFLLDGDNIRLGLNASPDLLAERHSAEFAKRFGLAFSAQDREENIRRIGEVAHLFCCAGTIVLVAFVSPYRRDRDAVRNRLDGDSSGDFIEVLVDAPLEVCEKRDSKGLYQKARAGQIQEFTGIDDPYEAPENPELILDTANKDAATLADEVLAYLRAKSRIQ